jgi:hypothetical protein
MAIAMNGGSSNRRQQCWWHNSNGLWQRQRNGRWDGSAIATAIGDGKESFVLLDLVIRHCLYTLALVKLT